MTSGEGMTLGIWLDRIFKLFLVTIGAGFIVWLVSLL